MNDTPATNDSTTPAPATPTESPAAPAPATEAVPDSLAAPAVPTDTPPAPTEVEGGQVEPVAPLTLEDITLPEGLSLEGEDATKFLDLLNSEVGAQDRANALVAFHAEMVEKQVQATVEEYTRQWTELEEKWKGEVQQAYPGDKLAEAQTGIAKILDRYGSKEVREAFAATGAGNNPHIFAFLHKMATDLVEKPPVQGSAPAAQPLDRAQRMFKSQ